MPSSFRQLRYLDAKGGPPPTVRFQAQRKDAATNQWVGSRVIGATNLSDGAIYIWAPEPPDAWQAPVWQDDEEKRVVIKEIRDEGGQPVEIGYVLEQDSQHHVPVEIASLAVWGSGPQEVAGWLIAPNEWHEDPDVEVGPWGQGPRVFLPEPS